MAEKPSQEWLSLSWIVSYPLFAVLAAMVFLAAEELVQPAPPTDIPTTPAVVVDSPEWLSGFPARVESVHEAVMAVPLQATVTAERAQGSSVMRWKHRVLELSVERGQRRRVDDALASLGAVDPGISVMTEDTFNGARVLIGLDGLLTHTILLRWADQPARPRVSLVVTALGDDLRFARKVMEVEAQLSIAVRPFRPFSAQVAELARLFERDVLLDWTDAAASRRGLDAALKTVPGAVGVALGDGGTTAAMLADVSAHGLFSVLPNRGENGLTVFLLPSGEGLELALESITSHARQGGRAIGVAAAGDAEGLATVRGMLTEWRSQQIDVVLVSQILGKSAVPAT